MTSTAPRAELDRSVGEWAGQTDVHDLLPETAVLLDHLLGSGGSTGAVLGRARLHLLEGRPAEGLSLLQDRGLDGQLEAGRATWNAAVSDACRAAEGDRPAFERLLALAADVVDTDGAVEAGYLVAAAADALGEQRVADGAWTDLPTSLGRVTALTLTHYAAATVAGRDREDPEPATAAVLRAARAFDHLETPLADDPGPAREAARLLEARGDRPGAYLLLLALSRLRVPTADLVAARDLLDAPQPARRRHRYRAVGTAVVASCVLVWFSAVGLLVGRGLLALWARRVRLPGLGLVDSRVARALRRMTYDDVSQTVRSSAGATQVDPLQSLAFVLGLFAGALVAVPLAGAVDDAGAVVAVGVPLTALTAVTVGSWLLARRLQRDWRLRRVLRREAADRRAVLAAASACACWHSRWWTGDPAVAYAAHHLVAGDDEALRPLALTGARLLRCPDTGYAWLSLGSGRATRLVRGAAPEVAPVPQQDVPIGMYL